jgi:hypothetical protein
MPIASVKSGREGAALPRPNPSAAATRPRLTTARGLQRETAHPETGPSAAPPTQMRVRVEAVAARDPPNSVRSAGKKTGNVLVMPVTSSPQAKASTSRPLARLSGAEVTGPIMTERPRPLTAAGAGS